MANVGRDSREEGVDRRLPLGRDQRLLRFVRGVEIGWKTVDLIGVEHDVMAQEPDAPLHLLAGFGVLLTLLERGIINRKRAGLTLADVRSDENTSEIQSLMRISY